MARPYLDSSATQGRKMIAGLLLRNFKTYNGINYIPLSKGQPFSALVGENGSGKSSVLEALDCYFNSSEWNFNYSLHTKGFPSREPFICPIFVIRKTDLDLAEDEIYIVEFLSQILWHSEASDFNSSVREYAEQFCNQKDEFDGLGLNTDDHYLIPIGIQKKSSSGNPDIYLSIFESHEFYAHIGDEENAKSILKNVHNKIVNLYSYIYLPSDIDFKEYTKIEGKTVQSLLGKRLDEIIKDFIPKNSITQINRQLNNFLEGISTTLEDYEYKKPSRKQNLFNQSHFSEKVIEAYFESKVLNKVFPDGSVPVTNLSSGEKRQAIIDIAKSFLLETILDSDQKIILAIDEPELSLHLSSCFKQFEKLRSIADAGVQVLLTTHWYGFMPAVSNGVAVYCTKAKAPIPLIDLRCFRDDIARLRRATSGGQPSDIELKSVNDLIQSILASITGNNARWIICEGSSDKIYLEHYLGRPNLYILAVGGSKYVKKIYRYIEMAMEENRDDIKGRVYLLLDTDKKFEKFDCSDSFTQVCIRRIQNNDINYVTELLKTTDNNYHPPTMIEDTLDASAFLQTLLSIQKTEPNGEFLEIIDELIIEDPEWPSGLSMNLRDTHKKTIEKIFNSPGFKIKFALKYIEIADKETMPSWIKEIENFLYPKIPRQRTNRVKTPKQ